MSKMLKVGITGRSGSGKTMVARHYASLGYPVADGDEISRKILRPQSPALAKLAEVFGADILAEDGTLLRRELAARAFAKPDGNQLLIDITHPYIINEMMQMARQAEQEGQPLFFMDGAMIVGYALQPYCDKIIVVQTQQEEAVKRIIERDKITRQEAEKRLAAQLPQHILNNAANYLITNTTTPGAVIQQANEVLEKLLETRCAGACKKT